MELLPEDQIERNAVMNKELESPKQQGTIQRTKTNTDHHISIISLSVLGGAIGISLSESLSEAISVSGGMGFLIGFASTFVTLLVALVYSNQSGEQPLSSELKPPQPEEQEMKWT
jgi:amino acid permease